MNYTNLQINSDLFLGENLYISLLSHPPSLVLGFLPLTFTIICNSLSLSLSLSHSLFLSLSQSSRDFSLLRSELLYWDGVCFVFFQSQFSVYFIISFPMINILIYLFLLMTSLWAFCPPSLLSHQNNNVSLFLSQS